MPDPRYPVTSVTGRQNVRSVPDRPAGVAPPAGSEEARRVKTLVLAGRDDDAREAFADLVACQQRRASRLALYLMRDPTEADEAVQDAFVKVYTHITSYREDLPFEAWFNRILANTCRDRKKARRRRQRWELGGLDGEGDDQPRTGQARSLLPSPEETVLGQEQRRTLAAAVDRLSARQREVFLLCRSEGQSARDVGSLMGLNESTVRVHLFRALRALRSALEGSGVQR